MSKAPERIYLQVHGLRGTALWYPDGRPVPGRQQLEYVRADLADPAHYKYMVSLSKSVTEQAERIAELEAENAALTDLLNDADYIKQLHLANERGVQSNE